MNEKLYSEQISLEEEMRGLSISKFTKGLTSGDLVDTIIGKTLMSTYINPVANGVRSFLIEANSGKAGRRNMAFTVLSTLEPDVAAYLFIKALLNRMPIYGSERKVVSVTSLAFSFAEMFQDERRIRDLEEAHPSLTAKVLGDFDNRELPRYKRKEYLQFVTNRLDEGWALWSKAELLHAGVKMLEIFKNTTGDVEITTVKAGRHIKDIVVPSEGLVGFCSRVAEERGHVTATWYPMIVPPVKWSPENLRVGGYLSHHVTPYPLVKGGTRSYHAMLSDKAEVGGLEIVLEAVNAMQETPWRVNTKVSEVIDYVFRMDIECGKLPASNHTVPDPAPVGLDLSDRSNPKVLEYLRYRATVHEHNRRSVGKRVMAIRALHMAERFSQYERIYFPHDLDSRGRAYPKPNPLNPQGPDYVKGLLEFADGKPLGPDGLFWLGVHGANCFGEDKLLLQHRADWAKQNLQAIRSVASDPKGNLWWTKADNPAQFLAFCFEYAEASQVGSKFVSHLHIDLDATCSGLQHFSAMLRDEVGGFHVNMTPSDTRQDVYMAVAQEALMIFQKDSVSGSDTAAMARAWLGSGLMDRKVTKRPVMVKPYAGTSQSCNEYVRSAVDDKLADGHPYPWAKDDMFMFKLYGGGVVWQAIPKVVVAADEAMRWLSAISRAVGRSQPDDHRIEWTTPVGFPVWQRKMDTRSRQITTHLDGRMYKPKYVEDTDKLDPRKLGSSTPPSFVHSLDGCHLQLTVAIAVSEGITHFAMVHDSFGVHAADVTRFSKIIREAFVEMYQTDVLSEFFESAKPRINPEFLKDIPPIPERGSLDLNGVLGSEFFFS